MSVTLQMSHDYVCQAWQAPDSSGASVCVLKLSALFKTSGLEDKASYSYIVQSRNTFLTYLLHLFKCLDWISKGNFVSSSASHMQDIKDRKFQEWCSCKEDSNTEANKPERLDKRIKTMKLYELVLDISHHSSSMGTVRHSTFTHKDNVTSYTCLQRIVII